MLALLALAGCAKEDPADKLPEKSTMNFTAETAALTKTSLNEDMRVFWAEGDEISVFSDADQNDNIKFTGSAIQETKATFTGKIMAGEKYFAVYPYSSENKSFGSSLTVNIPAEQEAVEHSFDRLANVAVAVTTIDKMQFENVGAIVAFDVPALSEGNIVKAVVKGNAAEKVAGEMKVNMAEEVRAAVPSEDAVEEVTLSGTFTEGSSYYLVLAPGEFTQGFTVTLLDNTGKSYSAKNEAARTLVPGEVIVFSGLSFAPDQRPSELYVKPDGNGQGYSWATAASLTDALSWAQDGNTIHMAAGTYVNSNEVIERDAFMITTNIKLIGGYPDAPANGDTPDPKVNETVISGSDKQGCLLVKAQKMADSAVELHGLTFNHGLGNKSDAERTENGAKIVAGRGGGIVVANSKVLLKDCMIDGNKGYSAPAIYNADGAETTMENCQITNNEGTGNGCAVWNTHALLIAKNCGFIANLGQGEGVAGPLYNHGENAECTFKTEAYIYNSVFKDNKIGLSKKQGSKRGGAIYSREGSNIVVVNTTFNGNEGGNGSAISVYGTAAAPSESTMISCTITGNDSYWYGAYDVWDPGLKGTRCVNSRVYNTIISGNTDVKGTPDVNMTTKYVTEAGKLPSVFVSCTDGENVYDNAGELMTVKFNAADMLSPYLEGVLPLTGENNPAIANGMTTSELSAIDMSMFPLFDSSFLSVDQQGNPRSGNKMGACAK